MAISSYPTPYDAGLLYVILLHAALFISFIKNLLLSRLHALGIRFPRLEDEEEQLSPGRPSNSSGGCRKNPHVEEFFCSQMPSITYASIPTHERPTTQECTICLSEFDQDAQVNCLSCGHVFHKMCLMAWFNYYNMTCPLCRNHMTMPPEADQEEDGDCPM